MCFNKLTIENPAWDEYKLRSRRFNTVRCGRCAECRSLILSEYAFRAQQETLNCTGVDGSKGFVYFNTLTYRPQFVPKVRMKNGEFISTWNKAHIRNLFKRVRKFFTYYYGIDSNLLRYLLTTERGSNRIYVDSKGNTRQAQELPHYHCIIWVYSSDCQPLKGKNLPKWCRNFTSLKDVFPIVFKRCWGVDIDYLYKGVKKRHHISYGHVEDLLVNRTPALATKYVCKYICKQYDDRLFKISLEDIVYHTQRLDKKDFFPFSLFSKGIGSSFEPDISHLTGEKKVALMCNSDKPQSINLPRYYFKRMCKKLNKLEPKLKKYVHEDYTEKEGYVREKCIMFFSSMKFRKVHKCKNGKIRTKMVWRTRYGDFPVEFHTESIETPLGVLVLDKNFEDSSEEFFEYIKSFILNSEPRVAYLKFYSVPIHESIYKISTFNSKRQLDISNHPYPHMHFVQNSRNPSYDIYKYVNFHNFHQKEMFSQLLWSLRIIDDYNKKYGEERLLQTIKEYYHDESDISNPILLSLDFMFKFRSDVNIILSSLKRYNQDTQYKSNITQAMKDDPKLFAPIAIKY